jgi:hypothetical protein
MSTEVIGFKFVYGIYVVLALVAVVFADLESEVEIELCSLLFIASVFSLFLGALFVVGAPAIFAP